MLAIGLVLRSLFGTESGRFICMVLEASAQMILEYGSDLKSEIGRGHLGFVVTISLLGML